MKASIYFNYTSRSLLRGGQRTLLAFFCVGVGVMAIVALQLVGLMVNNALTVNVRDANGGDINVSAGLGSKPFVKSDLSYFDQLKAQSTITDYTALDSLTGSFSNAVSVANEFTVLLVNPDTFPVVKPPVFSNPSDGSISSFLTGNGAIIDQTMATTYHEQIGDTIVVHAISAQRNVQLLPVKVVGVVTDTGVLAQNSGVVLISQDYYQQTFPQTELTFNTIEVTTADQAHTNTAVNDINHQYQDRFLQVQTTSDALKTTQNLSDVIQKFLEIAGLLALLIGGVGIVNTMQVLLSRRKIEIAMLKTTGYRRKDLYLLFGLEAGMLGLIGGVIGSAAAIGVSDLVRNVVQQVFGLDIPFLLNWPVIVGGILIGFLTALIFGLMPIVQAANIRPLSVIRDLSANRTSNIGLTILLLLILSVLFCAMSVFILNDVGLSIVVVYSTFVFLLILSGIFALVASLVGLLPVPERFSWGFVLLLVGCAAFSLLISLVLPTFGYLLLALTVLGFLIVLMPKTWKVNARMALRNLSRQRARTTTTLLALFVGIFVIGLTLALGQDVGDFLNNTISTVLPYNVTTAASGSDAAALQSQLKNIPGLQASKESYQAQFVPGAINGRSMAQIFQDISNFPSKHSLGREGVLAFLSSINGYDVANGDVPASSDIQIEKGRNLNASDAGTNNILVPEALVSEAPLKGILDVGSTIEVTSLDGSTKITLTVVGVYRQAGFDLSSIGLDGTKNTVVSLSPGGQAQQLFSLKIDPAQMKQALTKIGQIAPNSETTSLADIGSYVDQFLKDVILVLIVIASLSLLAGVIIIANAVALAMLERRRELGILKSVGYTSRTVLGQVLIENATIGGLGGLLAMFLVTFATSVLGNLAFKSSFSVNGMVVLGLILGSALLAAVTALLVAWNSVRVRPLEVLRYE